MKKNVQALHDKFQLNVVFSLRICFEDSLDLLPDFLQLLRNCGARTARCNLEHSHCGNSIYEIEILVRSDEHMEEIRTSVEATEGLELLDVLDTALESHRGGTCEVRSRTPIRSNTDLRIIYTPGVARVCKAIERDPSLAKDFTSRGNKVAIATNGTAILGLGDIGPLAGLPVMEGKAAIFSEFVGVSAEPLLVDTKDPDEFVAVVEKLAYGYGAIQIEDVAAPDCFKITRELDERLDIPVFHDDQYCTATVVLAGLYVAVKRKALEMENIRVAISGAGAAGVAIADLLLRAGVGDVVLCDSFGIIYRGRKERMNEEKEALAEWTNTDNITGSLAEAMKGRELFVGVSVPGIVTVDMVKSMAKGPLVFALANPVSEISRDDALGAGASIYADGRMMNNALAYPGIFRGALNAGVESITKAMMMAAAKALASLVPESALMPEMMDKATHRAVSEAVEACAKDICGD